MKSCDSGGKLGPPRHFGHTAEKHAINPGHYLHAEISTEHYGAELRGALDFLEDFRASPPLPHSHAYSHTHPHTLTHCTHTHAQGNGGRRSDYDPSLPAALCLRLRGLRGVALLDFGVEGRTFGSGSSFWLLSFSSPSAGLFVCDLGSLLLAHTGAMAAAPFSVFDRAARTKSRSTAIKQNFFFSSNAPTFCCF